MAQQNNTALTEEQTQQDISEQAQIRRDKLAALQAEGRDPFVQVRFDFTSNSVTIKEHFDELEGSTQKIAGRLMSKRGMGKASFCDLQDQDGRIQIYVQVDDLGEEEMDRFKKLDIGDIIGCEGEVFRTKRGEISLHVKKYVLLAKSIRPLPDKWGGLKDMDLRYRQRYVDMIVNPEVRETFKKRAKAVSAIRRYMDDLGYIECETPILNTVQGGATARPFVTHHNALNLNMYLRIATELYLKRCIVGGLDRVYDMGRIFRNEGMDATHNPEFTTIEFYEAYTDINGMMERTEGLMKYVAKEVTGGDQLPFGELTIDFSKPFARETMTGLVKKYSGVDFDTIRTREEAVEVAKAHNIQVEAKHQRGDILSLFFEEYCEDKLIQPTFVLDHPIEISPLTKKKPDDPMMTQRFELFIAGHEYANAYSELNDPIDQRQRFEAQMKLRELGDLEASEMDEDFLLAVEYGMPPTGGCGIGVDRFVMLLTNNTSIRDVLLFPTMKPEGNNNASKANNSASEAAEKCCPEEGTTCCCETEVEEKIDFSKVEIEPLFADSVDFETFSKSDFRAVKVLACEAVPKSKKLLKFTLDDGTPENRTILSGIHAYYEPEELVGKTLIAITNLPPRAMMGIESCGMLLSAIHQEEGEEKLHLLMVDKHIPAGAKLY
ncbi:MAG: lysine--tRNA ligase [Clostridia bacterium]|nr:lysine--tRNA ligase [Clostridia bacterium]